MTVLKSMETGHRLLGLGDLKNAGEIDGMTGHASGIIDQLDGVISLVASAMADQRTIVPANIDDAESLTVSSAD